MYICGDIKCKNYGYKILSVFICVFSVVCCC